MESGSDKDLDGLLRKFFQSEMPRTWPAWKAPGASVVVPARTDSWSWSNVLSSRFALAASIAVMILGFLFVSDKLQNGTLPANNPTFNLGSNDLNERLQIKNEAIKINRNGESQYRFDVETPEKP